MKRFREGKTKGNVKELPDEDVVRPAGPPPPQHPRKKKVKIKIELEFEDHIGVWLTLYIDGERKFSFIPRMPDDEKPRSAYEFEV